MLLWGGGEAAHHVRERMGRASGAPVRLGELCRMSHRNLSPPAGGASSFPVRQLLHRIVVSLEPAFAEITAVLQLPTV